MGLRLFQVFRNKFRPRLVGRGAVEIINTDAVTNVELCSVVNTTNVEVSLQGKTVDSFYGKADTTSVESLSSGEHLDGVNGKLDSTSVESIVQYPVDHHRETTADVVKFESSVSTNRVIFETHHSDRTSLETTCSNRLTSQLRNVDRSSIETISTLGVVPGKISTDILDVEETLSRRLLSMTKSVDCVVIENTESTNVERGKVSVGQVPLEISIGMKRGIGKIAIDRLPIEDLVARTKTRLKITTTDSRIENFISRKDILQNYGHMVDRVMVEEFFFSRKPLSTAVVGISSIEQVSSLDKMRGISRADETGVEIVAASNISFVASHSIDVVHVEHLVTETSSLLPVVEASSTAAGLEGVTSTTSTTLEHTLDVLDVEGITADVDVNVMKHHADCLSLESVGSERAPIESVQHIDQLTVESITKTEVTSVDLTIDRVVHEEIQSRLESTVEIGSDMDRVESLTGETIDRLMTQPDQVRHEGIVSFPSPINLENVIGKTIIESNCSTGVRPYSSKVDSIVVAGIESFGVSSVDNKLSTTTLENVMSTIYHEAKLRVEETLGEHIISRISPDIRSKMEKLMMEQIMSKLKKGCGKTGESTSVESIISEPPIPPYSGKGSAYIKTISLEAAVVPSESYVFSKIFIERIVADSSQLYVSIYLDYFTNEVCLAEDNGFGTSIYTDSLGVETSYAETNGFGTTIFIGNYIGEAAYGESDGQTNIFMDSLVAEVCFSGI